MNPQKWRKTALALSAFLFILWWALGTGATLAWFSDVETVRNEFRIGLLDLDVSYKNAIVKEYTPLKGSTEVFYDEALYEPGYTQVVYLKIDNNGEVDFKYKVSVTVADVTTGKNAWGEDIYLPNYLRYGVVFAESEAELQELVKDRLESRRHAAKDWGALGTWSKISPYTHEVRKKQADPEYAHYAALIIYMPEDVGNVANYVGITVPSVDLGITVLAQQANAPMN